MRQDRQQPSDEDGGFSLYLLLGAVCAILGWVLGPSLLSWTGRGQEENHFMGLMLFTLVYVGLLVYTSIRRGR